MICIEMFLQMKEEENKIDLNIDNYNVDELLLIYEITELPITREKIIMKTNVFIDKFSKKQDDDMVNFFEKAKERLLRYIDDLTIQKSDEAIIWENKYNTNQLNQPVKIVDENNEPIVGSNITTKTQLFIVLNSEFIVENNSDSTDYLVTLPDTIYDVISLRLYSVSLPYTWYKIDSSYGNNFFYLYTNISTVPYLINIEEGNYNPEQLVDVVSDELRKIKENYGVIYNSINGKTTLLLDNEVSKVVFFGSNGFGNAKMNYNLGWILGYRKKEYINVDYRELVFPISEPQPESEPEPIIDWKIVSESPCVVKGTQYIEIYIDDFQKNRQNTNIINVYQESNTSLETPINYNVDYQRDGTGQVVFASPGITKNQICAINKIEEDREREKDDRTGVSGVSDIFAVCNVPSSANIGDTINLDNPILQTNIRNYLSQVNISKMRVRLLDDKGNNLNLNSNDWTMTIICERQYLNPI